MRCCVHCQDIGVLCSAVIGDLRMLGGVLYLLCFDEVSYFGNAEFLQPRATEGPRYRGKLPETARGLPRGAVRVR